MGANETWRAIEAAKDAFSDWSQRPAKERSNLMRRWYDLIMANVDDLGALMTAEQGKPLAEAKGEVAYAASFIEWFAEEAKRVYGDTIPSPWKDRRLVVIKQPIGVCAAMTPWNFPAAMIARKAGPALAAGCTMIAKTGELDALFRFCARGAGRTCRIPLRSPECCHWRFQGDRRRDDLQSRCAQDHLHRIDRSRPFAHEAKRQHD